MRVSSHRAVSWVLAALLLSVVAVSFSTISLPISLGTRISVLLLPVGLGLSIWTRAIARDREPTDIVLALFSLPVMFLSVWSIYGVVSADRRGIMGLVALAAGILLAIAVLADAVIERTQMANT